MKSEINTTQISTFFKENPFVKSVTIQNKKGIFYHPDILSDKKAFFKQVIDECMAKYPENADCFMITGKEYICICKRKQTIYICETDNHISVSQVKMELENLIEGQRKQSKLSNFFTSFFD
ncbi:MAG: hypothetical protein GY699_14595 [Desulfobacteraceae bacterium]|nr:hypothetical protein [Desulfobacteraceae bacterium]